MDTRYRPMLATHCVGCHGPAEQKGKFRVDDLPYDITTIETAEKWQKVLNQMNSGEMPPEDEEQPTAEAKTDFLDTLSTVMVNARRKLGDNHGNITMRRLNRREYKNTIRDLLGVEIKVNELPDDSRAAGFDTTGASLYMSANQFEQYESLAKEALEEAFALRLSQGVAKKLRYEVEETYPTFIETDQQFHNNLLRARAWTEAVGVAMDRPQNAKLVADLLSKTQGSGLLRTPRLEVIVEKWQEIPGAPDPKDFGIPTEMIARSDTLIGNPQFARYNQHYLQMPKLDTGAYLTLPSASTSFLFNNCVFTVVVPPDWPPGEYRVRIRIAATAEAPPERRFLEFGVNYSWSINRPIDRMFQVTGTMESPQVIEFSYYLRRKPESMNERTWYFREPILKDVQDAAALFRAGVKKNGVGPDFALWVDWIEVERQQVPDDQLAPGMRALTGISLDDKSPQPTAEALKHALERFIREAYRGTPAPAGFVDRLLSAYQSRIQTGSKHTDSLRETLVSVLSSPRFLFLAEPKADDTRRELSGRELATRLSYFLWSAPPDAALSSDAASGALLKPGVLAKQTERMLADSRSADFVSGFLSQWLVLDRLDFFQFNPRLYPLFEDRIKKSARREVLETFTCLLRENAPLTDLLTSDYVVVDGQLANYYGLTGVQGDEFRKVALPKDSPRGGLIGMAAVHAMGSNGEISNPVERGAWVLRKLMNEPPPPAPPNVPQITRLANQALTTRERLQAHQEAPQCASCHRKIDPIGLGLENFDAAGQWRTNDSYQVKDGNGKFVRGGYRKWAIEPAGQMHNGPSFADYQELRSIIASRGESFAIGFTSALIEYALGRPWGFSDQMLVKEIVTRAQKKDFASREFIHALVQSKEFRTK